jgi:16S rRNA (cytidine1402-2'-O)-methyltransferase
MYLKSEKRWLNNMATLYVISTPIGNLGDISFRAVVILKTVHTIICEDTRVTKKLLSHYDIQKPTISYHGHSGITKIDKIIKLLEEGKDLALVSDAGTPAVSDPGSVLISEIRKALPGVAIATVPGPSAVTAALSISGVPASDFLFLGFLPHKKGREALFKEIAESKRTVVFYESPHRIMKTLESLALHLNKERGVHVAKELTKIHEEIVSGTPNEVKSYFKEYPDKIKGEFVVIVEPF